MRWPFDVKKFRRRGFVACGKQLAEISPAPSKASAWPCEWKDDDYSANSRYWTKWQARDDDDLKSMSDDVVKIPSFCSQALKLIFKIQKFDPSPGNLFVPNMKVEAVDRRYPGLVW